MEVERLPLAFPNIEGVNTKPLLDCLLKLQSLEFDNTDEEGVQRIPENVLDKTIASLRLQIPLPMLNHYDRLTARGKKGVAAVRHQTCTGCHVQVTKAVVINLMRGEDIQVCENCGRYLFLPEPDLSGLPVGASHKNRGKLRSQAELPVAA